MIDSVFIEVTNDASAAPGLSDDETVVRIATDRSHFGSRGPRQMLEDFLASGGKDMHPHPMAAQLVGYLAANLESGMHALELIPPETPVVDYEPETVFVIRACEFSEHPVIVADITDALPR